MVERTSSQSDTARQQPALFGREREQEILRNLLDDALDGRGSLVLISGEAGIGKTALVRELARSAKELKALVLTGNSYDLTITPPYGPWIEILDVYERRDISPRPPPALTDAAAFDELQDQAALFRETRAFLSSAARERPLVLILEDIHWADKASLELLRYLGWHIGQAQPLLLVVTYRDDEVSLQQALFQLLPLLVRESHTIRIELQRLDYDAVQQMIRNRYRLSPPDEARLVSHLHKQADGNPLFLGELIRAIESSAILVQRDDAWTLAELRHARTPPLVRQVIERRMETLSGRTRELLEFAAVIGASVSTKLWLALSEANQDELNRAVMEAVEEHVLEESPDGDQLQFTHALIRETLYEGVPLPRKQALHRTVGDALVDLPDSRSDTIAHHFQQAGDDRALQWLLQAAEEALRSWAWIVAAERFEAAEKLLLHRADLLHLRGWLLLRLAMVRRSTSPYQSVMNCETALQAARALQDAALEAASTYFLGENRFFIGMNGLQELSEGLEALQRLSPADAARLEAQLPKFDIEHMTTSLFIMQSIFGCYREAISGADEFLGRGLPRVDYVWTERGHAEAGRAHALSALGRPDEAVAAFRLAQDCYMRARMDWTGALIATLELQYVSLAYQADDLVGRRRLADEVEQLWSRSSRAMTFLPPRYGLLPMLLVEGHWNEAFELAQPFANLDVVHHDSGLLALAVIARNRGIPDIAWTHVHTVFPDGPRVEAGSMPIPSRIEILRLAAELALDAGDVEAAGAWITTHDRWIELGDRVQGRADARLLNAKLYLLLGDQDAARRTAHDALRLANDPRQPFSLIAVRRFLGELDLRSDNHSAASEYLQESLELAIDCAAPFERALTLVAIAELHANSGHLPDAIDALDDAIAICLQLGAAPVLTRADEIRNRLLSTQRPSAYPAGLTPREVDVLMLVAEGLSDAEVGERLFIARRTVTSHLTSIYTKLGVSSRAAATRFAVEQNLTSPAS